MAKRPDSPPALPAPAATVDADDLAEVLAPIRMKRKADFVRHYLVTGNSAKAAALAGYSARGLKATAFRLLHDPVVARAVAAGRAVMARRTEYDFARASRELDRAKSFAYETANATAAVRAAELLAKLHGHLVDRQDIRHQGAVIFQFPERRVAGEDPRALPDRSGDDDHA